MGLFWTAKKYNLPSVKTVDDVKNLVATNAYYGLPSLGYTATVQPGDVAGVKGSVIIAVAYLGITGSEYWELVTTNGDKTDLSAVVDQLAILHRDYF
jgi:hypothetical protein